MLTGRQRERLLRLFTDPAHVEVEATWGVCQRMITAYRYPDRATAKTLAAQLIADVSDRVRALLKEIRKLGRTLK